MTLLSSTGETTDLCYRERMGAVLSYFVHRHVNRIAVVQKEIKQVNTEVNKSKS